MTDKDNSVPFWRAIRGVGRPGTHVNTREQVELKSVPERDYTDLEFELSVTHMPVNPPTCTRCGLKADRHWPNEWYCHFCLETVKSPVNPNAMIPTSAVPETGLLEPTLSDPRGDMICPKCATTRRPRADNQGFDCACGTTWTVPGVRRVSPTNGF